jgi:L-lactate permease
MWIVITAIWLYELTVRSGHFEDLRLVINVISDDPRIQAIIVAFCFGGLLEALAGFGAPVAITGVMLVAVGFTAMRAAVVVLVANTAPVAFGAIAIPIITAGTLTGIDYQDIGAMVGHQTPFLAAVVPLFLVLLVDGRRGLRQIWPLALVVGIAFGLAQYVSANVPLRRTHRHHRLPRRPRRRRHHAALLEAEGRSGRTRPHGRRARTRRRRCPGRRRCLCSGGHRCRRRRPRR